MTVRESTTDATLSPHPSDEYAELARAVRGAGLMDRRRGYYLVRMAVNLLLFAAGWVVFAIVGDSWWQLLTAAFFAVMFAQLAFIGHDAGHRQIFRSRKANDAVGHLHGALVGISYEWWVDKHVRHHANPNHEGKDPDLDIPLLAFSLAQSGDKRGFVRWTSKYQAFLFFPLLLLEGLNLHWASVRAVVTGEIKRPVREGALLLAHAVLYLTAVFTVLSPPVAIAFIAVHQGLWGVYMGCSFAPNHKGMPTVARDTALSFFRKQVMTSRNIKGGWWVDFLLGGLNYQIEHHLFPAMPRPNLRRAQAMVRDFCAQRGVDYAECGLLQSFGHVLRHLHAVGAPLRVRPGAPVR